jgi:hypothetical protein
MSIETFLSAGADTVWGRWFFFFILGSNLGGVGPVRGLRGGVKVTELNTNKQPKLSQENKRHPRAAHAPVPLLSSLKFANETS